MTLIVDDSIDVWGDDLPNLCLTRRFVGDKLDDGLQLLSWQITQAHQAFFEGAPINGFSYDEPTNVTYDFGPGRGDLEGYTITPRSWDKCPPSRDGRICA